MANAYDIWLATDPWWEGKCGECAQDEDECECEEEEEGEDTDTELNNPEVA